VASALEEEIYEAARLLSRLGLEESKVREQIKWVIKNKKPLTPKEMSEIFGSSPTLSRVKTCKVKSLRYDKVQKFYAKISEKISQLPAPTEIKYEQEKETTMDFLNRFKMKKNIDFYKRSEFPTEVFKHLLEWVKISLSKEMVALDIATGAYANAAVQIAPYVKKVIAIDISDEIIKSAEEEIKRKNIENIEVFKMNMEEMNPEWKECFDIAILNLVPITEKCLNQVRNVLKPNGILLFSYFSEGSFKEVYDAMGRAADELELQDKYLGPRQYLTIETIAKIFKKNELHVEHIMIKNFNEYFFKNIDDIISFAEIFMSEKDIFPFKNLTHGETISLIEKIKNNLRIGRRKINLTLKVIFALARRG
jgi:ubiquinone/menaquinone biosynthesis C-methylase UbiE